MITLLHLLQALIGWQLCLTIGTLIVVRGLGLWDRAWDYLWSEREDDLR